MSMIEIETQRLLLREFLLEDAPHLFRLHADPDVMRFTGDTGFMNLEEAELFINGYAERQYHPYGTGRLAVIEKDTGAFCGWCGLKTQDDGQVEIDYRLFPAFWGRGYATEASKACLRYGFEMLGLEEIIADAMEWNIASLRVKAKSGMEVIGKEERHGAPTLLFRLTREQYFDRPIPTTQGED